MSRCNNIIDGMYRKIKHNFEGNKNTGPHDKYLES